jgi:hypothetical protein
MWLLDSRVPTWIEYHVCTLDLLLERGQTGERIQPERRASGNLVDFEGSYETMEKAIEDNWWGKSGYWPQGP